MTATEIKANYLDIYRDIFRLKEKVKIPHPYTGIKNIVYTVDHGTKDWVRDLYTTLSIGLCGRGDVGVHGIYRLTLISNHQFNIIVDDKTYSGGTATLILNGERQNFNVVAVNSSTFREKTIWCLEFVDDFPADIPRVY